MLVLFDYLCLGEQLSAAFNVFPLFVLILQSRVLIKFVLGNALTIARHSLFTQKGIRLVF